MCCSRSGRLARQTRMGWGSTRQLTALRQSFLSWPLMSSETRPERHRRQDVSPNLPQAKPAETQRWKGTFNRRLREVARRAVKVRGNPD